MNQLLCSIFMFALFFNTYSQESIDSVDYKDGLNEIEVMAAKKNSLFISEAAIPSRMNSFEDKKENIDTNLKQILKQLKGAKKNVLSSTGCLSSLIHMSYKNAKQSVRLFCVAIDEEITLAKIHCDCQQKIRLNYISDLEELQSEVRQKTQKVDDEIAKLLRSRG